MAFVLTFPLYCKSGTVLYQYGDAYHKVECESIVVSLESIPYKKREEFRKELNELFMRISGIKT